MFLVNYSLAAKLQNRDTSILFPITNSVFCICYSTAPVLYKIRAYDLYISHHCSANTMLMMLGLISHQLH